MPFRRRDGAWDGSRVSERIRREVIAPLEALVERVSHPRSEIPEGLRQSLENVFATVSESFAAFACTWAAYEVPHMPTLPFA